MSTLVKAVDLARSELAEGRIISADNSASEARRLLYQLLSSERILDRDFFSHAEVELCLVLTHTARDVSSSTHKPQFYLRRVNALLPHCSNQWASMLRGRLIIEEALAVEAANDLRGLRRLLDQHSDLAYLPGASLLRIEYFSRLCSLMIGEGHLGEALDILQTQIIPYSSYTDTTMNRRVARWLTYADILLKMRDPRAENCLAEAAVLLEQQPDEYSRHHLYAKLAETSLLQGDTSGALQHFGLSETIRMANGIGAQWTGATRVKLAAHLG
ncbi:hypothetical protein ACN3XK_27835 [Actinomadura welshii]